MINRAAIALTTLVLVAVLAPSAAAQVSKSTYRVLVTQPDEGGLPVSLDTDVYLPATPPPAGGYPFVAFFHGGGSDKDNGFDAGHARFFAEHGYATILYSARGHGSSDGEVSVIGPKEIHDLFDVLAWALGAGGPGVPAHPSFHLDRDRIALTGYSQGGLHANLGQAWSGDRTLNPYGIRFRAIEPGNTPDITFNALVTNDVVKLSFGVGLVGTYASGGRGRIAPIVDKWVAVTSADQPGLYGGDICDFTEHDTSTSTMRADLAARSPGCMVDRMTPPSLWAQGFDDTLFPAEMGISMWRRMPDRAENRLYLSMGGHAAPSASEAVEKAKLGLQLEFMDHVLRGRPLAAPRVTYFSRDAAVPATGGSYAYRPDAWVEQSASTWPPPGTRDDVYRLGADGTAVRGPAAGGSIAITPFSQDNANDPVARSALSATPLGSSPPPAPSPDSVPGQVAAFATVPFSQELELSGAPRLRIPWTPASSDTQVVLKVLDVAPDGRLTLLSRGVQGIRGAQPGQSRTVTVTGDTFSAVVRGGHRVVAWVSAGDASFYKAYPGMAGGAIAAGDDATLSLPMRGFSPSGRRPSCLPRRLRVRTGRVGRLRVGRSEGQLLRRAGTASVRGRHSLRWCVRGGGKVAVALSARGRARLVASTARGHRAPGLRRGQRLRAAAGRYQLHRISRRLYLARRGRTRVVIGTRRGRIRFLAATGRREAAHPRQLRRDVRRSGILARG